MTRHFYNANGRMPDEHEAWLELWTNPPKKYGITHKGDSLKILSEKKELTKPLFKARWNKYIAPPLNLYFSTFSTVFRHFRMISSPVPVLPIKIYEQCNFHYC